MNKSMINQIMEVQQRSSLVVSSKSSKVCSDQEEFDQDSGGSSEEMESPRSVGRWRRTPTTTTTTTTKKMSYVHSQILRIREEDSHLGESVTFSGAKDNNNKVAHAVASRMDVVLFARHVLPSSPLKNTVNALH